MTTISPIRYEVEIQEPLSTPVPMPPSMLSSEALVIWMLRIAMKAPIIAAKMAIQTVTLARSGLAGAAGRVTGVEAARESVVMASPLRSVGNSGFRGRRGGWLGCAGVAVAMVGITDMPGRSSIGAPPSSAIFTGVGCHNLPKFTVALFGG